MKRVQVYYSDGDYDRLSKLAKDKLDGNLSYLIRVAIRQWETKNTLVKGPSHQKLCELETKIKKLEMTLKERKLI